MIAFPACSCGHRIAVARIVRDNSVTIAAGGEVLDRTGSDALEDVECASCGNVVRSAANLTAEEADLLLDGWEG